VKIGQRVTLLPPNPDAAGLKESQKAVQETGNSFSDALSSAITDVTTIDAYREIMRTRR
jgi:flagellar hook-basal body complex protein FliE